MQICVLVGNPKPASRTRVAAEALAARLAGPGDVVSTIDLADHAADLFDWSSASVDALSTAASSADLLIVASPTYKATYTGLLKAFLDRYPTAGLSGVTAIAMMSGGDAGHSMAPDVNLRPLLVELGASLPTASFYLQTPQQDQLEALLDTWCEANLASLWLGERVGAGIGGVG